MSYSLSVMVKDGKTTVTTSGTVPDGEFQLSGHEDGQQRSLSVTRRGTDGRYVESAGHTHYKEV